MIDWENQQVQQQPQLRQQLQQQLHLRHAQQWQGGSASGNEVAGGGAVYVKVMTDEQLETLRKQIAVYCSLCEQLVEAHKNLTAQQDLAGARLGSLYCDPFMTSAGHKISSRQRWTPTPMHLQILESIFDQGTGTPSKQKIKDITAELSQHGQISETNVYNWFQNRRARSKRKQQNPVSNNNPTECETEAEVESAKDKKTRAEDLHSQSQHCSVTIPDEMSFQNYEVYSDMHYLDPQISKSDSMISADGVLKVTTLGRIPAFDGNGMLLLSSRNDYVSGKMEASENLNYQHGGDYLVTD